VDEPSGGTAGAPERLRLRYRRLLADDERSHQAVVDAPEVAVTEVRDQLRLHFDEHPEQDAILLRINGQDIGVALRITVMAAVGDAGDDGPGSSDGASLPGDPAEFQLIVFRCVHCRRTFFRSYFDLRTNPACHGRPAELIREPS